MRESQFSGAANTGATYLFESWYLARGDINILNSMGTARATFTRNSTVWVAGGNDQYKPAPSGPSANTLNWGTMFRFSFIANQGPKKTTFAFKVANPGSPQDLKGTGMLVPARTVQSTAPIK